MSSRRKFLAATMSLGFANSIGFGREAMAQAAPPTKPRIVMVTWRGKTDVEAGFIQYWRATRQEIDWVWRDAAQSPAKLADIASDIVRLQPDLVYTWGTSATLGIAGPASRPHPIIANQIPLVFALVADPVAAGITTSLTNHGRNLTGVSHVAPLAAQLAAMRAYRDVKAVGIIYNKLEPNAAANVQAWQQLGEKERFPVWAEHFPLAPGGTLESPNENANRALVEKLASRGINWLYLGPDTHLFTQVASIARATSANRLATFAAVDSLLSGDAPVLCGLVSKFDQVGQFAAFKGQQLLSGKRNIAIESLKRLSLVVRLDVAKSLNLYPPMSMLDRAEFRQPAN